MPDGGSFEKMDISTYELPATIVEVNKAANGGYVFQVSFAGFNPGNVAMIGVSADGKVTGTKCITNTESSGFGADHIPALDSKGHYNGADVSTIDAVDTVAGCTVSTKAYRAVVKDALNAAVILGGGSVDLRDPAQILNDNLNAALGTEGAEFDKHFFVEIVEGVDAIYVAKNGAGHVVVIGEEFIGVDAEGNVIGGANEAAANAVATIKATTLADVDLTKYEGVSKRVKSAKVTDAGVYVIEVEGAGFGISGDAHYGASGEYIVVRVAITKDGTVVDCYTVYQNETNGFGSACADEEFYGQFAGKTEADYKEVIIAGSTITTKGYQGAILYAFKAVKIFEGGAK
jgi:Na+-translocating ferredoxin:NAD+ oxidoreductase RnfG subunit